MGNFFSDYLKGKAGDLTKLSPADKTKFLDAAMSEAKALDASNRDFARQLATQLSGNYRVEVNERPDGSGFFYGMAHDNDNRHFRVDVLPPRLYWSGDFMHEAVSDTDWIVHLDGVEVERAEAIGGLSALRLVEVQT